MPDNDVRVIYNWAANSAGPLGFPVFNGGSVSYNNCNPYFKEGCRPALVANALGVWTTGSWPATQGPTNQPDPLASTGATRNPFRKVLVTACVVDDRGSEATTDDRLIPRAQSLLRLSDISPTRVVAGP